LLVGDNNCRPGFPAHLHRTYQETSRSGAAEATVRGARKDGARATSPAANRLVVPMLRLMPAVLQHRGLSPNDELDLAMAQPPRLPGRKP